VAQDAKEPVLARFPVDADRPEALKQVQYFRATFGEGALEGGEDISPLSAAVQQRQQPTDERRDIRALDEQFPEFGADGHAVVVNLYAGRGV
jgi:hypothetical protein